MLLKSVNKFFDFENFGGRNLSLDTKATTAPENQGVNYYFFPENREKNSLKKIVSKLLIFC